MNNNDFANHLRNERLNRVNLAWKYLKPWQQAWLYVRAVWWSMPSIFEILDHIEERFDVWLTYRLYKAHWL